MFYTTPQKYLTKQLGLVNCRKYYFMNRHMRNFLPAPSPAVKLYPIYYGKNGGTEGEREKNVIFNLTYTANFINRKTITLINGSEIMQIEIHYNK